MTDPFDAFERVVRESAAIEAHAQALAAISPALVTAHVEDVARRYAAVVIEIAGHEATVIPAAARELLRLAAERRAVAHTLARLAARDPIDLAMLDGLVLDVVLRTALAQAAARNPLRNAGPSPIFPETEPD